MDADELICPITLETFRDPVRASDGRVYERDAIARWIIAHGTSPFTREPLRVEDLQADDRLKTLASRRRDSTVSYDVRNERVTLPPIRTRIHHGGATVHPLPQPAVNVTVPQQDPRPSKSCIRDCFLYLIVFCIFSLPSIILTAVLSKVK